MNNENDEVSEEKTASENSDDTISDSPTENEDSEENVEIIYKKERNPIVKFILGFAIFLVTAFTVLFVLGFVMGLMGIRPPTLDNEVLTNQWEKVTNGEQTEEPPNELETKTPSPSDGSSSESE